MVTRFFELALAVRNRSEEETKDLWMASRLRTRRPFENRWSCRCIVSRKAHEPAEWVQVLRAALVGGL